MPLFMDRHDLRGTTAADIAEAHRKDLEIQDQYGVRFLTYWFDEQRGTVFCLADAPDKAAVQCVHREAHGHLPGEIVEVAVSAVEAFLGRIQDPAPKPGARELPIDGAKRTVMFTDMAGSVEMTNRLGDIIAAEMVRAHDGIVRRALDRFGGREVKHTGDGIMASFDTARAGVDSARIIQQSLATYNDGNPEPIYLRIGLDCGEPVEDCNDLFGATVQMAARLCEAAAPGEILVSGEVRRACRRRQPFTETRRCQLKGFRQPVVAHLCDWAKAERRVRHGAAAGAVGSANRHS